MTDNTEIEVEIQNKNVEIEVEMKTKSLQEGVKTVNSLLQGLNQTTNDTVGGIEKAFEQLSSGLGGLLADIGTMIVDAFTIENQEDLVAATARFGGEFANELYAVQNNLNTFQNAVVDTVVPLAQVVVPVINDALSALSGMTAVIGETFACIVSESIDADIIKEKAGNMLSSITAWVDENIASFLQTVFAKVQSLIDPFLHVDFSLLFASLEQLSSLLLNLGILALETLEWLWFDILVPLSQWVIEEGATATINMLSAAFETFEHILTPVVSGVQELLMVLEPAIAFIKETVIFILSKLQEQFAKVGTTFNDEGQRITEIISGIGEIISKIWVVIEPIIVVFRNLVGNAFDYVGAKVSNSIGTVIDVLHGLIEFVCGVFAGDWDKAWDGVSGLFLDYVNGVIGAVNAMISGVVGGMNIIVRALNKMKFTIPDWIPGLGGEVFSLNLKELTAPQIPYLAKGAVLPANKPFMAVVGDQRHGTNIEAPLTTIQEAVAGVMDNHIAAMMAGFNALLQEQIALRHTVESIELGDNTIAEAVERYHEKMSIVYGYGAG